MLQHRAVCLYEWVVGRDWLALLGPRWCPPPLTNPAHMAATPSLAAQAAAPGIVSPQPRRPLPPTHVRPRQQHARVNQAGAAVVAPRLLHDDVVVVIHGPVLDDGGGHPARGGVGVRGGRAAGSKGMRPAASAWHPATAAAPGLEQQARMGRALLDGSPSKQAASIIGACCTLYVSVTPCWPWPTQQRAHHG